MMISSNNQSDHEVPFVIGAGLGRTGTHSLQAALLKLGHSKKSFHMTELLDGYAPPDKWFVLAEHERATGMRNKTMALEVAQSVIDQGYTATTDYPACLLFAEFLELKPDAKVVLSIRSNPKDWKNSVLETIGKISIPLRRPPFSFMPFFQRFTQHLAPWLWERTGVAELGEMQSLLESQDTMEDAYLQWIETVKSQVPEDQLLIHHAKDGYEPLCQFMGIENCPDEPYPHLGDTQHLKNMIHFLETINLVFWPAVGVLVLGMVWIVRRKGGNVKRNFKKLD